jgi:hypothetical protein
MTIKEFWNEYSNFYDKILLTSNLETSIAASSSLKESGFPIEEPCRFESDRDPPVSNYLNNS